MLNISENSCNLLKEGQPITIFEGTNELFIFLKLSNINSQRSFINIDNISWSMAEAMHVFILTSM
jgi:hypothetical protein